MHCALVAVLLLAVPAAAVYRPVEPRALEPGEIAVTGPGVCDRPGATYVLAGDVVAQRSGLFLADGVTLDLNGHTLTYAAGYQGVDNAGFEDGLTGWDTAAAPGADARAMPERHPLIGRNVCRLPEGQSLTSPWVTLPEADRAYYAMVSVASHEMVVGIHVEDAEGREVECAFRFGDQARPCCPEVRTPKLGGGVVFALLFGQPAGRYRVRVEAVRGDCVIDEVDLLPALDVGVGIVDRVLPWAYYKCILDGDGCAFFDLRDPADVGAPRAGIPRVTGRGTITVRNGVIRLGSKAVRTWGLQSTAGSARLVVDNVKFEAAGINCQAISAPAATLRQVRAEVDQPWIIDRHRQMDYVVHLSGPAASEIADSEFIGGQGQVSLGGEGSSLHDCLLVNRQTVTNHYSLSLSGRGSRVYRNRILPEQGSGILIGRERELEIVDNEIAVSASPPINEYAASEYSVNAIRLTDYNAKRGDPAGWCGANRIHHNTIRVTGRRFAEALERYHPLCCGIFMSVGGEPNEIADNTFIVDQLDPPNSERHGAYAFYVGASDQGGIYTGNTVVSNVTPVFIGNYYGPAAGVALRRNTFRRAAGAAPFVPFQLGWYRYQGLGVEFISNTLDGLEFGVEIGDYTSGYTSTYRVGWTLTVLTSPGGEVIVRQPDGTEAARGTADAAGRFAVDLIEYDAAGAGQVAENGRRRVVVQRTDRSRYVVTAGGQRREVVLNRDLALDLTR